MESKHLGAACCPGPGPAQPGSCHRGQGDSDEVNQKSPGWSQLLGWPGINPWGELAAGSRSRQQGRAAWEGQNQILKDARGKSARVLLLGGKKPTWMGSDFVGIRGFGREVLMEVWGFGVFCARIEVFHI